MTLGVGLVAIDEIIVVASLGVLEAPLTDEEVGAYFFATLIGPPDIAEAGTQAKFLVQPRCLSPPPS